MYWCNCVTDIDSVLHDLYVIDQIKLLLKLANQANLSLGDFKHLQVILSANKQEILKLLKWIDYLAAVNRAFLNERVVVLIKFI